MSRDSESRNYRVEGLARGLRILSIFSEQRRRLKLTEVADLAGLPVPTVFRLLRTLEDCGYIERSPAGEFTPGAAVLSLGFAALQGSDLAQVAAGPLKQLNAAVEETVNLGVLVGAQVLYLQRIRNADLITANVQVGSLLPVVATSIGKMLLAYQDPAQLETLLGTEGFAAANRGPNALKSLPDLRGQLALFREQGWAFQDEELAFGLRSVAAPVRDETGQVVAALNVAVSAGRWTMDETIERFLEPLLNTAAAISARLGFSGGGSVAGGGRAAAASGQEQ
jgi:IclR family pca regulon transcriptional regulator